MKPVLRAMFVFLLAVSAFNLGRYSVEFSGRPAAWVSLIFGIIVLAIAAGMLMFQPIRRVES